MLQEGEFTVADAVKTPEEKTAATAMPVVPTTPLIEAVNIGGVCDALATKKVGWILTVLDAVKEGVVWTAIVSIVLIGVVTFPVAV